MGREVVNLGEPSGERSGEPMNRAEPVSPAFRPDSLISCMERLVVLPRRSSQRGAPGSWMKELHPPHSAPCSDRRAHENEGFIPTATRHGRR